MFNKRLLAYFWAALLFANTSLFAIVKFKQPINLQASVGVPFTQSLIALLEDVGTSPYTFVGNGLPAWLKVQGDTLSGTPTTDGVFNFRLTVKDATPEGVDLNAPASITVLPPPPKFISQDIDLGTQKEDTAWTGVNLKSFLVDGSLANSFEATGMPPWMILNASTGDLSGTPRRAHVGNYSDITFKAIGTGGFSTAKAHGNVTKTIHPPKWTLPTNNLGQGLEDQLFSKETKPLITLGDGTVFQFSMTGAPSWLSLDAATGALSGTPHTFGNYSFTISFTSVIDGGNFSDTAAFSLTITHVNHAPKWSKNPIPLPDSFTAVAYSQPIASFASDPDAGDTLSYSIAGPAWGKINAQTGIISGTPAKSDIGANSFQVTVTDNSGASAATEVQIKVIKSNEPPQWLSKPTILPDANEDFIYSVALNPLATDPDNDPKFFTLVSGPAWATISNGNLVGRPGAANVGLNKFQVKVSDHIASPDDTAELQVIVAHTNHAPSWTMNPIVLSTNEDSLFSSDLAVFATDPDPTDTLSFSLVDGPAWATLSPLGVLSGTPHMPEVGLNIFTVKVVDNGGLFAETKVRVTVLHINHPPTWTQNPITLTNANDDAPYTADISSFANDIDPGDTLKFTKIDAAPSWLSIDNAGKITATPTPANVGSYSFQAKVADAANASATTTVKITVVHVNHAPKWSQNPIVLPDNFTGVNYSQALASFASDQDTGDVLTFSLTGPAWGHINSTTALLSGVSQKPDIGPNTFQAKVTDNSGLSAITTVQIKVIKSNEPPQWLSKPTILPDAKEDFVYSAALPPLAVDPDGDPKFFTLVSGPSWASIDANGKLVGTPGAAHVGLNKFQIKVSDHIASPDDTAEIQVTVIHTNHAPLWTINPIPLTTTEDILFSSNLATFARDPDVGDTLTFTLVDGPAWATLSPVGVLSGTPHIPEEGLNTFTVMVADNGGLSSNVKVLVTVLHINHPPTWTQNPITLANAKDDTPYTADISSFATDIDPGDTLKFTKIDAAPSWLSIDNAGKITATPTPANVGSYSFQAKVADAANASATTTVKITVVHVNHAPKWSQNPIVLPDNFTGVNYSQALASFASDQDTGDVLTFSITGPAWAHINSTTAVLSGVSQKPDIGDNTFTATVTDNSGLSATTTVKIKVIKSNEAPQWLSKPTILPDGKEDFAYSAALPPLAVDPDNNPLFFTLVSGPSWASIDANGNLVGTPGAAHLGLNKFQVKVSDHIATPDDVAELQVMVAHTNHAPSWTLNPVVLSANEDAPFSAALAVYAKDPDVGDTLSYSLVDGPAWATLSAAGVLSGTPHAAQLGLNTFTVKVADNAGLSAETKVRVTVVHINHAPTWTLNPIILTDAKDDAPYTADISSFATDIDPGDTLRFSKIDALPAWLAIDAAGKITATPKPADVGSYSFLAKVTDAATANATTTVKITVVHVNHAPKWSQNPIVLPNGFTGVNYLQSLASFASDPDAGDTLTFSMTGPAWAKLNSQTANLSGIPQKSDIGDNSFLATVTDNSGLSATTTVQIKVLKSNEPPQWLSKPTVLPDAKEDSAYSAALPPLAVDPDGDPKFFTMIVGGPSWASIDANGNLVGTPGAAHVGLNKFQVKVSDHIASPDDTAEIQVTVIHTNHAPSWTLNPVALTATEDAPFSSNLATFAQDPDVGDTLSFSLVDGPAWATLTTAGVLSGTPRAAQLGLNTFTVSVADNGGLKKETKVLVTVVHINHAPTWTLNPIILTDANDDAPYTADISSFATDIDPGDILKFSKIDLLPPWLTVDSAGKITANPKPANVGSYSFQAKVADAANASAITTVKITVVHVNHAPKWSKDPIILPNAFTAVNYIQTLASFASDPDAGDILTFSMTDGPAWATMSSDGKLSGTPKVSDVGTKSFEVTVTDNLGLFAKAIATLTVIKSNEPPQWKNHPTIVADAVEDSAYSITLAPLAADPDNDPLFFTKVEGPAWATIDSSGHLVGIPKAANIGLNKFQLKVSDHISSPDDVTEFQVMVTHVNHPPFWILNPVMFSTPEDQKFIANVALFAGDPDVGDTLTFSLLNGPAWGTLSNDGVLTGTPSIPDEGPNTFDVTVSDPSGATASAKVIVTVLKATHAPYWTQDPIILPHGNDSTAYTASVKSFAKDPDVGDILKFSKVGTTPAWVVVGADGNISGRPAFADIGLNTFKVKVTDPTNLSAEVTVQITIDHLNRAPHWTANPINLPPGSAGTPYSQSVASYAVDPDQGDTLTFSMTGPVWASIDPTTGVISGTPAIADLGDNFWQATVTDAAGASDTTVIKVNVKRANQPPVWLAHPTLFPNISEGHTLSISLPNYASDPDGDPLFFTLIDGPSWASISNGKFVGTPSSANVGLNKFHASVSDHLSTPDDVTEIQIFIDPVNHAPYWVMNPILLSASSGVLFTSDISPYAKDPDAGDTLIFTLVSGPSWLQMSATGKLTGTPQVANSGANNFVVRVTDGAGLFANASLIITVDHENQPPVISTNLPRFVVKERQTLSQKLTQWVIDPDGDALTFTLMDQKDWIRLATDGTMTLSPQHKDLGTYSLRFSVSDGSHSTSGLLQIDVIKDSQPPRWNTEPIAILEGKVNQLLSASVRDRASDPNNQPLTFSKKSGDSWLAFSPDALLSGTPLQSNLGTNTFILTVCNADGLCADGTLIVNVKGTTVVHDTVQVDAPVIGALSENLWVIDAPKCSTISALRRYIGAFYGDLDAASIHHSGVFLSADPSAYDGRPIYETPQRALLIWNESNIVTDFQRRLDSITHVFGAQRCSSCRNSPLWAMRRFYQQAPSLSTLWHSDYLANNVAMDVMIVSEQKDQFRNYAKNKPEQNWNPGDYGNSFLDFHNQLGKPYRISAITSSCNNAVDPAYGTVVSQTQGTLYPTNCHFDMQATLHDYAKKVIQRAYITAKQRIPLSKTPSDASQIKVSLASVLLNGNTGAANDKWNYDSNKNEIILHWNLIGVSQVKPGDMLSIEYPTDQGRLTFSPTLSSSSR